MCVISESPSGIVFNYFAVQIISNFDSFIYGSFMIETKKLIERDEGEEEIFIIHNTTSVRCLDHELSTVKDKHGNFRPLRIRFRKRTLVNKLAYVNYWILRMFYHSFYYYFMPFLCFPVAWLIPNIYYTGEIL